MNTRTLTLVSATILFSLAVFAQDTIDVPSVPARAQLACLSRAASEFGVKTDQVRIRGFILNRGPYKTVDIKNDLTGETATCEVDTRNAAVISLIRNGPAARGFPADHEPDLEFETQNHRVRVFRLLDRTIRMDVYNKGTKKFVLRDSPVFTRSRSRYSEYEGCSTGRTPCTGVQYTVRSGQSGSKSLNIRVPRGSANTTEQEITSGTGHGSPDAQLFGRRWKLTKIEDRPVGPSEAYIEFDRARRAVSGSTGCNQMSGSFDVSSERLTFGPLISTNRACVDNRLTQVESEFTQRLPEITQFEVQENMLRLYAGNKLRLTFFGT
jgi:heat shock protein HslJ